MAEKGFVAYFDILGYKTFLQKNDPNTEAETILAMIKTVPNRFRGEILLSESTPDLARLWDETSSSLVFSDTILLANRNANIDADEARGTALLLVACVFISQQMFERGMPVRGAITYGDFLISGHSFAGEPIVEAYEESQKLDLAATVVADSAYKRVNALAPKAELLTQVMDTIIVPYLTPTKLGDVTANLLLPALPKMAIATNDLRQYVLEAFWKHKKDIDSSGMTKAQNTETFLRFCKMKHPECFPPAPLVVGNATPGKVTK